MNDSGYFLDKERELFNANPEVTSSFSFDKIEEIKSSMCLDSEPSSKLNQEFIFKSIGLLSTDKQGDKGLIKSVVDSLANIKNTIKFNLVSSNKQANFVKDEYVLVAGIKFQTSLNQLNCTDKEKDNTVNDYILKNFVYLSYRSGFNELKTLNNSLSGYSTDCGWGCMIRSAQMILAKAILTTKLSNSLLKKNAISENLIQICRIETILLFSDNFLGSTDVYENSDFDFYKVKKNVKRRSTRISSLIQADFIEPEEIDEYITNKMSPPFSIQLISLLGELYGKGAGKTFSDINCIQIFEELNAEMKPIPNLDIMWTENIISEKEIVERFLQKEEDPQEGEEYYIFDGESYRLKQIEMPRMNSCTSSFSSNNPRFRDITCNVSGVLFISIRLGLSAITSEYFDSILKTFSFHGSLGIIGGENNKGFYYIGANSNNELLFLDPHFNQKCFFTREEMISQCLSTYLPSYVYKINISKISPAFTIGFIFNKTKDLITLIDNLRQLSDQSSPILKVVKSKKDVVRKTLKSTEVDDNYDLIDYQEICDK